MTARPLALAATIACGLLSGAGAAVRVSAGSAAAGAGQTSPTQLPSVPSFTTRADVVRVDVLVTRDDRPVTGLTADAFDVFDNGVRQAPQLLASDAPVDVVLALDTSESMKGAPFTQLTAGVRALLDRLRAGDRVAVVAFADLVLTPVPLSADRARAAAVLNRLQPGGLTSVNDASYTALLVGDPGVRTLVIVFSDGFDRTSWLTPQDVVEAARRLDSVVYGIRLAPAFALPGADQTTIHRLPRQTGGRSLVVKEAEQLNAVFRDVLNEFRQRYVLTYEPRGVTDTGWHEITVTLKPGHAGRVNARAGYFARRP